MIPKLYKPETNQIQVFVIFKKKIFKTPHQLQNKVSLTTPKVFEPGIR